MLQGYDRSSASQRALQYLEKDVCHMARTRGGFGMAAEDIEQELRIHLWRKIHLYDPRKAGIRAWAQRVMRMRLIDLYRGTVNYRRGVPRDMMDAGDQRVYPAGEEDGLFFLIVYYGHDGTHTTKRYGSGSS